MNVETLLYSIKDGQTIVFILCSKLIKNDIIHKRVYDKWGGFRV